MEISKSEVQTQQPTVQQKKPSYIVGTLAGAATAAALTNLYIHNVSELVGEFTHTASDILVGDVTRTVTPIADGVKISGPDPLLWSAILIGGVAGAIRTAAERNWKIPKNGIKKWTFVANTTAASAFCSAIPRCLVDPYVEPMLRGQNMFKVTLSCSILGTALALAGFGPLAIVASEAASYANKHIKTQFV